MQEHENSAAIILQPQRNPFKECAVIECKSLPRFTPSTESDFEEAREFLLRKVAKPGIKNVNKLKFFIEYEFSDPTTMRLWKRATPEPSGPEHAEALAEKIHQLVEQQERLATTTQPLKH